MVVYFNGFDIILVLYLCDDVIKFSVVNGFVVIICQKLFQCVVFYCFIQLYYGVEIGIGIKFEIGVMFGIFVVFQIGIFFLCWVLFF